MTPAAFSVYAARRVRAVMLVTWNCRVAENETTRLDCSCESMRDTVSMVRPRYDAVLQRLGGEPMLGARLEAEQVTSPVEVADLATTIAHHARGAHRTRHDLVDEIGVLLLAVDLLVARKVEVHPHVRHEAKGLVDPGGLRRARTDGGGIVSEGHVRTRIRTAHTLPLVAAS
jgi:hypothetical protein